MRRWKGRDKERKRQWRGEEGWKKREGNGEDPHGLVHSPHEMW